MPRGSSRALFRVIVLAATLIAAGPTRANDNSAPPDKAEKLLPTKLTAEDAHDKRQGWIPKLTIGASFSFAHSRKVVGAQDGQTWNIGPAVDASLDFYSGGHEWRNDFSLREVFTKTPVIDEFIKTVDQARLETFYLYHIGSVPWLGPYVQFRAETSLFSGEDIRGKSTSYQVKGEDNSFETDRLGLTRAFSPTRLKQVVGLFATPFRSAPASLEFRLGVGAQQIWVRDGLVIEDVAGTSPIELRQMHDFQQMGAECAVGLEGTVLFDDEGQARPITYSINVMTLMPFLSSRQEGRSLTELIGLELDAKVSFRLVHWASLDYNLRVIRAPLIVDEYQVQNNVLLNFSYTMSGEP